MDEESELKPEKLIDADYSYENIVKNPILKEIAETDRTLYDLTEMAYKKTVEAIKDKTEINEIIQKFPAYQSSNIVAKLIKINQETRELVQLQNLIIRNLRNCIKEVYKNVMSSYGVYKEEVKTEKKINYGEYLKNSCDNESCSQMAKLIFEEFNKDKSNINEKRKFERACGNVYAKQDDTGKTIIAKILRMEY